MNNMFSFIIPVYNVNPVFLETCVQSVLENKTNIEIILVDDCSKDNIRDLCDLLQKRDKRIRVVHMPENKGVSNARNTGIDVSNGNWIVFVDADDWIESNLCERIDIYCREDVDVVLYSAYKEYSDRTAFFGVSDQISEYCNIGKNVISKYSTIYLRNNLMKKCLKDTPSFLENANYCWGKAFNRRWLMSWNARFPAIDYCEDIVFMYAALKNATRVVILPDRLYHYRINPDSVVNSFRKHAILEQRRFLELIFEQMEDDSESIYYAALLSMQICISRYLFNKENKNNLIIKYQEASRLFSKWPYSEVFRKIDCNKMKKKERLKNLLIKYKLYHLYYLGTIARK